jgi:hypothetical protein
VARVAAAAAFTFTGVLKNVATDVSMAADVDAINMDITVTADVDPPNVDVADVNAVDVDAADVATDAARQGK